MSDKAPVKLRIPRQDLEAFSRFTLSQTGAAEWAAALPVTNAREVALALVQTLGELNRVALPAADRYAILEAIRPNMNVAVASLSRKVINQPLVLPEEPRQLAELSDQLLGLASTAYTLVAVHAIRDRGKVTGVNPARLACEALQRAIDLTAGKIFQYFLLYQPSEGRAWQTLHQLYHLAERQHLTRLRVDNGQNGSTTIQATWLRPVLLSCCKPNQVRQGDLTAMFRCLQEWGGEAEGDAQHGALFAVDLDADQPATYAKSTRFTDRPEGMRLVDTAALVVHLRAIAAESEDHGRRDVVFDKDVRLHHHTLLHVIEALSSVSMRNFNRTPAQQNLQVTLGLSNAHYFSAGKQNFDEVLHGKGYQPPAGKRIAINPFLVEQKRRDPWVEASPDDIFSGEEQALPDEPAAGQGINVDADIRAKLLKEDDTGHLQDTTRFREYRVKCINASPGGYCLAWEASPPGVIRSGDLLCVREKDNPHWVLATIRWVSQLEGKSTLMGVELLSPGAEPWGARIHAESGLSEPIRVLLLPEIKLVAQPPTLVTPHSGFREGQGLTLLRYGETRNICLQRLVAATGTYSQFEFRKAAARPETGVKEDRGLPASPFQSIWSEI
ncbi:MAG: hypothetical protein NWQ24_00760 [Haliea sp.]|jgi:cyclic-di-GMP-binding protein|nr:hypothetical protein [Haliea sp.]